MTNETLHTRLGYRLGVDGRVLTGALPAPWSATMRLSERIALDAPEAAIELRLSVTRDDNSGVLRLGLDARNVGETTLRLDQLALVLDLPIAAARLHYYHSDWGTEFSPQSTALTDPVRIGSFSGRSSKGCIPYVQLASGGDADAPCAGLAVAWSGNWELTATQQGPRCLVAAGLAREGFYTELAPGATFHNLELHACVLPGDDREALAAAFRRHHRRSIQPAPPAPPVPTAWNSWWAYEDREIDEDVFVRNAAIAAELGPLCRAGRRLVRPQ